MFFMRCFKYYYGHAIALLSDRYDGSELYYSYPLQMVLYSMLDARCPDPLTPNFPPIPFRSPPPPPLPPPLDRVHLHFLILF